MRKPDPGRAWDSPLYGPDDLQIAGPGVTSVQIAGDRVSIRVAVKKPAQLQSPRPRISLGADELHRVDDESPGPVRSVPQGEIVRQSPVAPRPPANQHAAAFRREPGPGIGRSPEQNSLWADHAHRLGLFSWTRVLWRRGCELCSPCIFTQSSAPCDLPCWPWPGYLDTQVSALSGAKRLCLPPCRGLSSML